jgi:hypothetical protein
MARQSEVAEVITTKLQLEVIGRGLALGWLHDAGVVRRAGYAAEARVATTMADSLVDAELLCELLASMAVVLERNISDEFARDFKARATANIGAVAHLIARHLPWLPSEFTEFFAEGALTLTAGMYPFSVPTEPVRTAMAEMGFPEPHDRFSDGLRIGLVTWLIGAAAQTEA